MIHVVATITAQGYQRAADDELAVRTGTLLDRLRTRRNGGDAS